MFQISGKLSVSSLTSTLGTAAIAANAVAGNISSFLNVPASAVGIGALTVVGQCLGAGEKVQAKRYSRLLLLTAYAGDWVMNLSGLFFLNKLALSWFNLSPEAYGMALELMVWFNAVSLILWPSSFTLPNILRAAGDAAFTITRQRHLHVGVPGGLLLPDGAQVPLRPAVHLDGHVPGLGSCARGSSASALSAASGWNKR